MNMDDLEDTDLGRRKVLLVAADFVIALARARKLQQLGCRVLGPAGSARAAVDLLHRTRPELALLDPTLPERQLEQVIATLETRGVPGAFTTVGSGTRLFGCPATGGAAGSLCSAEDLKRPLRGVALIEGEPCADLPAARVREHIRYQCRVIAALAAAERDTNAAEAALRHMERHLARIEVGAARWVA
jgi:hypothetical protein